MKSYGFIIIRHVNSLITNEYWLNSIKCIRKFYNEEYKIIVIDDNSDPTYLTSHNDDEIKNVEIIVSDFKGSNC